MFVMRPLIVALLLLCVSLTAQTSASSPNAPDLFNRGMNALEGSSATRSIANAIDYLRRSADLGYAPAQVVLGYLYETGRSITADPGQALDWYKKAAGQGDPLAQWLAGRMIYLGEASTRDFNQAADWFAQASSQGDPFAEYLLGKVALERSNYSLAAEQFRKASEQGLPQAESHLAQLLREGRGLPMDKFEAYVWMLVSGDTGFRIDQQELQALEAELSSSQVEQAKTKARDQEGRVSRSVVAHGCTGWRGEIDDVPAPPPPDLQRFCR